MNPSSRGMLLAAIELAIAVLVIAFDLFIPTLIILMLAAVSLLARRGKAAEWGLVKPRGICRMALTILLLVIVWSLLQLGLIMPLLNRLTGTTQDLSAFADLKGHGARLLTFLVATWTLAAFGEEIVYRGYLQRRVQDVTGSSGRGVVLAVGLTSLLFGLAHTEQGMIGIVVTALDAVFFSLLKLRYSGSLWASILAHGLSNTLGLVTFFFTGPIYGLW